MSKRVVVIGAGPGGYVAAIRAAQLGASVTVIEADALGGTCLNRGCIPTKALVASVETYEKVQRAGEYGVDLSGQVAPNLSRMLERARKVVGIQVKGIEALFKSWGIRLLRGNGILAGPGRVRVVSPEGAQTVEADRILLATGSKPAQLPAFPFDGQRVLTSDDVFRMRQIPRSMLIVGAGAIGSEFACIFAGLGTAVTVVEMLPRVVPTEDSEISALLAREFKKRRIKLHTKTRIDEVYVAGQGVVSTLSTGETVATEKVLVSIGRSFNTAGLGLEKVGITAGKRGEIPVNEHMQTAAPGIYAVGDVTGGIMLAHVASWQGKRAAEHALGHSEDAETPPIPWGIFTLPEIGSVGLREDQAREQGRQVLIGRFPFRGLGKAHAQGEIVGLAKIIADAETHRILGAHLMGAHAADLIHEVAAAMTLGARLEDLARTVHAHPTLAEAVAEAADDALGHAIHVPPRS